MALISPFKHWNKEIAETEARLRREQELLYFPDLRGYSKHRKAFELDTTSTEISAPSTVSSHALKWTNRSHILFSCAFKLSVANPPRTSTCCFVDKTGIVSISSNFAIGIFTGKHRGYCNVDNSRHLEHLLLAVLPCHVPAHFGSSHGAASCFQISHESRDASAILRSNVVLASTGSSKVPLGVRGGRQSLRAEMHWSIHLPWTTLLIFVADQHLFC